MKSKIERSELDVLEDILQEVQENNEFMQELLADGEPQSQPEEGTQSIPMPDTGTNFVHTVGTPILESTTTCSQDTTEEKINWQDEEDKIRRYKLGDKVRLKKTLIPDKDYDGCSISPRNYSYFKDCDCIVDIHIVDTNPVQYSLLAERGGKLYYGIEVTDLMIERIPEDTPEELTGKKKEVDKGVDREDTPEEWEEKAKEFDKIHDILKPYHKEAEDYPDTLKRVLDDREREVLENMRDWVVEYTLGDYKVRDFDAEIAIGKIIDRELDKLNSKKK